MAIKNRNGSPPACLRRIRQIKNRSVHTVRNIPSRMPPAGHPGPDTSAHALIQAMIPDDADYWRAKAGLPPR